MEKHAEQRTRFSFKCSFLELYNETITDLLRPSSTNLQVRPVPYLHQTTHVKRRGG